MYLLGERLATENIVFVPERAWAERILLVPLVSFGTGLHRAHNAGPLYRVDCERLRPPHATALSTL